MCRTERLTVLALTTACKYRIVTIMRWMSAFLTKLCLQMSRILCRHHWSTASIHCISALLAAQHSDPYWEYEDPVIYIQNTKKQKVFLRYETSETCLCMCFSSTISRVHSSSAGKTGCGVTCPDCWRSLAGRSSASFHRRSCCRRTSQT